MNTDLSEAKWFKSSYSGGDKACVEVAFLAGGHIGVRDSKNPTGPALMFAPGVWDAFTVGVTDGDFQAALNPPLLWRHPGSCREPGHIAAANASSSPGGW
ncbi:DUF397 domain-containing protein [Nocardia gamkensis]|uniref:DUF397 domain-containing protein n=1 Tax=Nocardia gamkensis TaxID=352869 RepID=A0A7X6R5E5_9NOCA|nr:DUF397 domain-containing protein [Nocardia gamkensis]NQE67023.1 hypothetical protein [Nocardia gamkensis]